MNYKTLILKDTRVFLKIWLTIAKKAMPPNCPQKLEKL